MKQIIDILIEHKIIADELERYNEPHRFYHNMEHINNLLHMAEDENILIDELYLAILFHDIIYNPKANNNEEISADLLYSYVKNDKIKQAILDTKTHKPTNDISEQLCRLDLKILNAPYAEFIDFENKIFKEYQFVDYKVYKEKRIEILKSLNVREEYINYVEHRQPNIAVYAGSFNPLHKGHLNIIEKAENIFDKVIIARGINTAKKNELCELPEMFRQVEGYAGLLTDFIDSLGYDATLVRGLRNSGDLQHEQIQYRFLQDLKPDIKVVSIFCDKEFEHISSSAIRQLPKDKAEKYL